MLQSGDMIIHPVEVRAEAHIPLAAQCCHTVQMDQNILDGRLRRLDEPRDKGKAHHPFPGGQLPDHLIG
ncbi:hypothetical protein D3C76_1020080 [compost metagenome]